MASDKTRERAASIPRTKVRATKGASKSQVNIVQMAADEKRKRLNDRLNSVQFEERLAAQGLGIDSDARSRAAKDMRETEVQISDGKMGSATGSMFSRDNTGLPPGSWKQFVRLRRTLPGSDIENSGMSVATDTGHELEHAFSNSFTPPLATQQAPLLQSLGASNQPESSVQGTAPDLEHMRTGIMQMRDMIGRENISPDDLQRLYWDAKDSANAYGRPEFYNVLDFIMKANPNASFDDIATMINTVASRRPSSNSATV